MLMVSKEKNFPYYMFFNIAKVAKMEVTDVIVTVFCDVLKGLF